MLPETPLSKSIIIASRTMPWYLYLLECADGSVYTGIAIDVAARFAQHAAGTGARYTRSRKPVHVLAQFEFADRASASSAEYWVKRLRPQEKRALVTGALTIESVLPPPPSTEPEAQAPA